MRGRYLRLTTAQNYLTFADEEATLLLLRLRRPQDRWVRSAGACAALRAARASAAARRRARDRLASWARPQSVDVRSDVDMRWLACLVWPGEGDRAERLAAAIASARRDPPVVHRGDLVSDVPALAAQAPGDATLVVYHSAVLTYVSPESRREFAATMRALGAVWLSN